MRDNTNVPLEGQGFTKSVIGKKLWSLAWPMMLSAAFLLFITLFFPYTAFAFSCAPTPDNWYMIDFTIDEATLPVDVVAKENMLYQEYKEGYYFENNGKAPLYLIFGSEDLGEISLLHAEDPITGLPFSLQLDHIYKIFRLVNGKNYYLHYDWNYETGYRTEWRTDEPGTSIYSKAFIDVEDLEILGVKTQQFARDNRPANVSIPDPHPFSFVAYYGNSPASPVTIRGTMFYALNQDYNPNAERDGCDWVEGFTGLEETNSETEGGLESGLSPPPPNRVLLYVILVLASGVVFSLCIFLKKRKKQSTVSIEEVPPTQTDAEH